MPGVTDTDLDAAERMLGVRLPPDYRAFLRKQDGYVVSDDRVYLKIFPLTEMVKWNEDTADLQREICPGLVYFGTDGSREGVGWDFRHDPPPVVLVDITTSGWSDALVQAPDFHTFLTQLETEHTYRWI
jgi:SMI1 / KNR4 family (SUKH-1)